MTRALALVLLTGCYSAYPPDERPTTFACRII